VGGARPAGEERLGAREAPAAAGTGCSAAIDAERWLEAHGHDSGASTDNWE
jgi:thioredoxin reductase